MKVTENQNLIVEALLSSERPVNYKSSIYYTEDNGVNFRISNHLPKKYNLEENADLENDKFMFIFTSDSGLNENEVSDYLKEIFENDNFDFNILDENQDLQMQIGYIKNLSNKL